MGIWGSLLYSEEDTIAQLEAMVSEKGCVLFEDFNPNPGGQQRFFEHYPLDDPDLHGARHLALIGGIGSGKSYCGAAWIISRALLDPKARGIIAANTFGQLSRSSCMTLVEVCRQFNIPLEPYSESVEDNAIAIANRQRCYIGPHRTFIYVLSMGSFCGNAQTARGLQARFAWLDEAAYAPEQAFQTLDGRIGRGPGYMKGQTLITTSPNGFNWLYSRFADPQRTDDVKNIYIMFPLKTRENVAALGDDYVSSLEANYTDELALQELEGEFVNSTQGRAYKYFDRSRHVLHGEDAEVLEYDPTLDLHVSFDFNYSPACAVMCQLRGNEMHFFSEAFLLDSDTWELSTIVCDSIREGNHQAEIYVYGDASGSARTAVSRQTNWDIVFDAFKKIGFHTGNGGKLHKRFEKSNPPVRNRIHSANFMFKADRIYVDLDGSPELVKDLEMLGWSQKGDRTELDKSDILRSHLSDAMSYMVHKIYPFRQAFLDLRKGGKPKGVAC